jgi:hypothetical protein
LWRQARLTLLSPTDFPGGWGRCLTSGGFKSQYAVDVRQYPESAGKMAALHEIMSALLTYTPGPPANVANLVALITDIRMEPDRKTEMHMGCTVEEIHLRADAITETLKAILDFHPTSHPELP